MAESKLRELSMDFAVEIINLVKYLKANHETIISNQIGRSGTSIGVNIHESQHAQGTKDFISKFEIVLKEVSETGYWLELLYRTKYIDEPIGSACEMPQGVSASHRHSCGVQDC